MITLIHNDKTYIYSLLTETRIESRQIAANIYEHYLIAKAYNADDSSDQIEIWWEIVVPQACDWDSYIIRVI
jgi:hypothetical protein